jgi:hypothetical protein
MIGYSGAEVSRLMSADLATNPGLPPQVTCLPIRILSDAKVWLSSVRIQGVERYSTGQPLLERPGSDPERPLSCKDPRYPK